MAQDVPKADDVAAPMTPEIRRPELVFGLIGPVGVDLEAVCVAISQSVEVAGYDTHVISVSELIAKYFAKSFIGVKEDQRIGELMDFGNTLRKRSGVAEAAATLVIFRIREIRASLVPKMHADGSPRGVAYIIRSLKNPQEVENLRFVYGKGFLAISVYSNKEMRVSSLAEKISRSYLGSKPEMSCEALAKNLMDRDENEENIYGQNVRDSFPLGDFFVESGDLDAVRKSIKRFMQLSFGNRFHTPTHDEHGMFQAASAALRSADLNRQVGAAITTARGEIIAIGCNDVPKAGGDQYWEGDRPDYRDFMKGRDSSAEQRETMLGELVGKMHGAGFLADKIKGDQLEAFTKSLLYGDNKKALKGAGLLNLLEFGRSVHAEMAALMTAARLGLAVKDAILYCTTFPCHMCARHIVASGIKEVVYIEPYPKSRAKQLHQDAIKIDQSGQDTDYVTFRPFHGIAPRQYQTIFMASDLRKDAEGRAVQFSMAEGKLRWLRFTDTYKHIEHDIIDRVLGHIEKMVPHGPTVTGEINDN